MIFIHNHHLLYSLVAFLEQFYILKFLKCLLPLRWIMILWILYSMNVWRTICTFNFHWSMTKYNSHYESINVEYIFTDHEYELILFQVFFRTSLFVIDKLTTFRRYYHVIFLLPEVNCYNSCPRNIRIENVWMYQEVLLTFSSKKLFNLPIFTNKKV